MKTYRTSGFQQIPDSLNNSFELIKFCLQLDDSSIIYFNYEEWLTSSELRDTILIKLKLNFKSNNNLLKRQGFGGSWISGNNNTVDIDEMLKRKELLTESQKKSIDPIFIEKFNELFVKEN